MDLPDVFCWTRFGVEAGQDFGSILQRKEEERSRNDGLFLWGIGNSVVPSLGVLLENSPTPKVVFSRIRSQPRQVDEKPRHVAVWTEAIAPNGENYPIPSGSLLTSHASGGNKRRHQALVLRSSSPLKLDETGDTFSMASLRNLRSGNPIGPSQVTAIVRYVGAESKIGGARYSAGMIVDLVFPFLVSLENPVIVPTSGMKDEALTEMCWSIRRSHETSKTSEQLALF